MRNVRLQFVTSCAVQAYDLLPHAQCKLTICYRMCTIVQCKLTICYRMCSVCLQLVPHPQYCIRLQSIKYLAFLSYMAHMLSANNLLPHVQGTLTTRYLMHRVCLQFSTTCTGYAYNSLPHAQETLTIRYLMHRVLLQFVTACAVSCSDV
jgi:hypothetical protein